MPKWLVEVAQPAARGLGIPVQLSQPMSLFSFLDAVWPPESRWETRWVISPS
jgi:hypothetical protein